MHEQILLTYLVANLITNLNKIETPIFLSVMCSLFLKAVFLTFIIQEKCQEQNVDLYMTFVDLTKSFDTVSHEGLWKIMAKFGCPAKFIAIVRQFHDGMLAWVQNDGGFSDPFPVTNEGG